MYGGARKVTSGLCATHRGRSTADMFKFGGNMQGKQRMQVCNVFYIFYINIKILTYRARLEHYEQSCAVDSVTKKCAGSPSDCRMAMLGILGTDLRTTCACKGTDMTQLYECLGWQRLLWVNPCVGMSNK